MQNQTQTIGTAEPDRLAPPAEGRDERARNGARNGSGADRAVLHSTPGYYRRAWRTLRHDKVAMVSLVVCIVMLIFSFAAPIVSRIVGHDYATGNLADYLMPWFTTWDHPLGTDANGRDILVRLAYGGRVSMTVAVLALFFALLIGVTSGQLPGSLAAGSIPPSCASST